MDRIVNCSSGYSFRSHFAGYAPLLQFLQNPYTVTPSVSYGRFCPSLSKPLVIQIPFSGKLLKQFSYGLCRKSSCCQLPLQFDCCMVTPGEQVQCPQIDIRTSSFFSTVQYLFFRLPNRPALPLRTLLQ